ncbi:hypothetical protein FACS1894195_3720 [Bacteroidia bacterium]|nr:hypothetical protein FACS1894195_3720 [Bacteroidia bacterium]
MKRICFFPFALLFTFEATAQGRIIEYDASLYGNIASKEHLPFWAISNRYGLVPDGNGGLLTLNASSPFTEKHQVQFSYGVSAAGYVSQAGNKLLPDQIYLSTRWKKIRLDLGMIHREIDYAGISSSNGFVLFSNNARTLPGYNLRTDYIAVPFTKGIIAFKGNLADYLFTDKRYTQNARMHNKSFFGKITILKRFELIAGFEHYAQWAGKNSLNGQLPNSLEAYERVFFGKTGRGFGHTASDVHKLGNHLMTRQVRINYIDDTYQLSLHYQNLMDDKSPPHTNFKSVPDGLYTFYIGSKDKTKCISDFVYEFTYTKWQTGKLNARLTTDEEKKEHPEWGSIFFYGSPEDYFNNSDYRSGWTHYGRTIGTPLITPRQAGVDGITYGVFNNRVIGHHIGFSGLAFGKIPYKALCTYTLNYGTYGSPLDDSPQQQFSFGLEAGVPPLKAIPLKVDIGIYGDIGKFLGDNVGLTLKLSRQGQWGM